MDRLPHFSSLEDLESYLKRQGFTPEMIAREEGMNGTSLVVTLPPQGHCHKVVIGGQRRDTKGWVVSAIGPYLEDRKRGKEIMEKLYGEPPNPAETQAMYQELYQLD